MHSGAGNWRFLVSALNLRPKFVSSRSHGAAGTPALLLKSLLLFCEPKKAAPQKQKRGLRFLYFEPALLLLFCFFGVSRTGTVSVKTKTASIVV